MKNFYHFILLSIFVHNLDFSKFIGSLWTKRIFSVCSNKKKSDEISKIKHFVALSNKCCKTTESAEKLQRKQQFSIQCHCHITLDVCPEQLVHMKVESVSPVFFCSFVLAVAVAVAHSLLSCWMCRLHVID